MLLSDSEFIRALQRFRFGTLVAMTDGDVVVPYASASIRNYNPYPSVPLTERFPEWRWHVHHSGFEASSELVEALDRKVDTSVESEQLHVGLDVSASPRFPSVDGYDADNKQEVEFSYEMIANLQRAVPWRRIDVTVEPFGVKGKMRLHDWALCKMQPPGCRADEFIELLCTMLGHDHSMEPLPPSVDDTQHAETTATAAVAQQSEESDERSRGSFVGNGIGRLMDRFQPKRSESARSSLSQEAVAGTTLLSPSPLFRRSSSATDEARSSFVNTAGISRFFDKFQTGTTPATGAQPSPSAGDKPRNSFGAGFTQLLDKFQKKVTTAPSSESTASNSSPSVLSTPPHPEPLQVAISPSSSEGPTGGDAVATEQQDASERTR